MLSLTFSQSSVDQNVSVQLKLLRFSLFQNKARNAGRSDKNAGMREISQNAGFPARLWDGWHLCVWDIIIEQTVLSNSITLQCHWQINIFFFFYTSYSRSTKYMVQQLFMLVCLWKRGTLDGGLTTLLLNTQLKKWLRNHGWCMWQNRSVWCVFFVEQKTSNAMYLRSRYL